ncbi:type 2 periplasmic-binding domain-containing protein [Streptomyces odonnellii]|uniref:substrate-binding domain-containing protein n=1 Tax=Streptomyces odonnellii TaxID=1417980 RepID=UPI0006961116|nr:substrate-binding domain-containing protein [Streptomyces odonnellii]
MNVKSRIRIAAAVGAAALGLSLFATPASADTPTPRALIGVGSDTTQDVLNGLAENVTDVNGNLLISSYNATGSSPINVGCAAPIARPNGSSAGIDALRNAILNNTGCIDFARSSRGPADTSTTKLTWIPFGKDAVTVAVRSDSALNTGTVGGLNLTTAQLRDIYTCVKTTHNNVALTPLLPQSGSGTRTFFLEKIGVTEAQVGTCVNGTVQEHDGTALDSAGDIAPYSIAQYIAQTTGVVTDRHGATVLGKVNSVAPRNTDGTLNVAFPYNRDVYNVVPSDKLTGGATPDANVIRAFATANSEVCKLTDVITGYGFGSLGTACGATTIKGER